MSYERGWTQAWCALVAAADGFAMLEWSPVATVLGTALVSSCAAVGYLSLRVARDREDPPRDWKHVVATSVAVGGGVMAFAAVSEGSPPVALLVVTVGLLTSPTVWRRVRRGSLSPAVRRTPPRGPVALDVERLVEQLEDGQLCRLWRWTFWELRRQQTAPELLDLVALRRSCLDELERRNPSALRAWLASGARASGEPDKFWSGEPPRPRSRIPSRQLRRRLMSPTTGKPSMPGSAVPAEAAPSRDDPTGREPDHRWLAGVWILVTGFALLTALRSEHAGIPLRDPRGSILVSRIAISLGPLLLLAVVDAGVRIGRRGWQADMLLEALRVKWSGERVRLALGGLLAYHLVYFCYHNLKSWDVFNLPRDDMLLRWDRWLFLGHDPATLLHDLLGQHVAAYVLMGVYESFSTLTAVSVVAALVFTTRIRDGYVFIASAMWVWILGVGSYYLIPSLGPFESDPTVYAGLPHTMIQDTQTLYLAQRAHLLAHPHSADGFAQVSAFASLHVAVTCLILLMARYHGLRRTTRALLVFLVGTILATVYLGWHFAVDDVAGLVIAFVAVLLGRLTTYPCGRPPVRTAA